MYLQKGNGGFDGEVETWKRKESKGMEIWEP